MKTSWTEAHLGMMVRGGANRIPDSDYHSLRKYIASIAATYTTYMPRVKRVRLDTDLPWEVSSRPSRDKRRPGTDVEIFVPMGGTLSSSGSALMTPTEPRTKENYLVASQKTQKA
jgi:hypothetical protein